LKLKTRIFGIPVTIALCAFVYVHGETRFVSHSGSNTFPYTSWETASNTIEAANLATLPGDTRFIDAGSFYLSAPIYTQPKITMRGKGMDSTHVPGSDSVWTMFLPDDSTYVYDIHFSGLYNPSHQTGTGHAFGKYPTGPWRTFFCRGCKLSRFGSSPIAFDKMIYVEITGLGYIVSRPTVSGNPRGVTSGRVISAGDISQASVRPLPRSLPIRSPGLHRRTVPRC